MRCPFDPKKILFSDTASVKENLLNNNSSERKESMKGMDKSMDKTFPTSWNS